MLMTGGWFLITMGNTLPHGQSINPFTGDSYDCFTHFTHLIGTHPHVKLGKVDGLVHSFLHSSLLTPKRHVQKTTNQCCFEFLGTGYKGWGQ